MIVYHGMPTSDITISFQIDAASCTGKTIALGNNPPLFSSPDSSLEAKTFAIFISCYRLKWSVENRLGTISASIFFIIINLYQKKQASKYLNTFTFSPLKKISAIFVRVILVKISNALKQYRNEFWMGRNNDYYTQLLYVTHKKLLYNYHLTYLLNWFINTINYLY